jgi:hypothetical protein
LQKSSTRLQKCSIFVTYNSNKAATSQLSFLAEDNVVKKVDVFERNLLQWLKEERTNEDVYLYTLMNGMRKTHTTEILKNKIYSLKITSVDKIRNGYFYLGHKPEKHIKIRNNE